MDFTSQASLTHGSANPMHGGETSCLCDGPECQSTTTCERWMATHLALIFSSADSPAREPAWPGGERVSSILRLLCGERWPAYCASYDHDSYCWRTSQTCLLSEMGERGRRFSGTWPRSGMLAHGTVYPLPPLVPRTSEIAYSPLLGTPTSRDWKGTGPRLAEALLPTPVASDDNKTPEAHMKMKKRMKGGSRKQITSLGVLARAEFRQPTNLLPTPSENDSRGSEYNYAGGNHDKVALKLPGVARLIGDDTPPPSSDGKPSSVPLLNPCFVEWMIGAPEGWSDPGCPLSVTEFKSRLDT